MAARHAKITGIHSVLPSTLLQFLLCHGLIFTGITLELAASRALSNTGLLLTLGICLLSLLLLLNIPYNLYVLESTLQRLARGLVVEPLTLRWRWPLTNLFSLVNALAQWTGQQGQIAQRNMTYRDQLLQQVRKAAAQEELNRLARDLHDSIKQQIFSIVVSTAAVKARWEHNPASARSIVDDIERTALEAQVEMQALLQQLRPVALENVGLIESLRMQCQALGYRTGAQITAELGHLPSEEQLPPGAQESIFRIVQEGFANIARYARPSHVWLSLQQQHDALLIEIGDDGQGFDVTQARERSSTYGGMGLENIRERVEALGGTVTVWSLPGEGTTLHLLIPLIKPQPAALEDQEPVQSVQRVRRGLRVGSWSAELAAALLLLYPPTPVLLLPVGLCLLVALAAWLWAQPQRVRVALDAGRSHTQHLALLASSSALLAGILLAGSLSGFAFDLFQAAPVWLIVSTLGVFITASSMLYGLSLWYTHKYYQGLALPVLRAQVRQQEQHMLVDWLAWGITTALVLTLQAFSNGLSPIQISLLTLWFVVTLLKHSVLLHCKRVIRVLSREPQRIQQEQRL